MKDVILVYEECHGLVGVASSYKAAIDCVIDWAGGVDKIETWNNDEETRCLTPQEQKEIYTWGIKKFNEKCDGEFHLEVDKLWES